jgi:hypothetical protein
MNDEQSQLNYRAPRAVYTCCTVDEWIAVAYSNKWHPGIAISTSPQTHSVSVRFLDVVSTNRFQFSRKGDTDILTIIQYVVNYHSLFT